MKYITIRVTEKKCATCGCWLGRREVLFRANRPFSVKVNAGPAPCLVNDDDLPTTPAQCCPWYSRLENWEVWPRLQEKDTPKDENETRDNAEGSLGKEVF